ncbi:MAG: tetratricopeptide repeat protein [Chloroflexi bacterium]|nr:tetratricopeptide repeat protein [Chloroflexota bacterium]
MPKRKHKNRQKHRPNLSLSAVLRQNGLKAFRQNEFATAIAQWSRLNLETESAVRPALAEAHFRRALVVRETPQRVADLRRALELMPMESRYWYHLGLAYHRADQLNEALAAYARAADANFPRRAVGFARGLAEVERNPRVDLETLEWLLPDDRVTLSPIAALLRGDSQAVLASHSDSWIDRLKARLTGNSTQALWHGLALLSTGQVAQARDALALPPGQSLPAGAEAVRIFYRGLALAATGNQEAALAEWTAAASPTPRQQAVIASAYLRQVRAALDAGQWAAALKIAQAAHRLTAGQPAFVAAVLIAHNRLANEAAARGDWKEAAGHWEEMRASLATASDPSTRSGQGLGPVAPILHNLAVAQEMLEQWEAAAGAWIALMGTLPRRPSKARAKAAESDGRPASLPVTEQRHWLRRRALDCYKKAGLPDQAITHYRQVVKANPDDLDLRLELANVLLANDQLVAGRNELNRILEKDPKHIEAQVRMAEVHQQRGEDHDAERLLRAVLGTDPQCDPARRGMVELLRNRGHGQFNAGCIAQSQATYEAALKLAPDDADLLVSLGYAELSQRNPTAARAHFEAALAKGEGAAYLGVFQRWAYQKNLKEAQQILARAEAAGVASAYFYVDAAKACFDNSEPSDAFFGLLGPPRAKKKKSASDAWEALGRELLKKAEVAGGNQTDVLQHIVATLGPAQPSLALDYARKLAGRLRDDPAAWMLLGLLQAMNNQVRAAKETLRRAADLARKQGDSHLLAQIEDLRRGLNNPLFGLLSRVMPLLGPLDEADR